jgi:hypothetical protein
MAKLTKAQAAERAKKDAINARRREARAAKKPVKFESAGMVEERKKLAHIMEFLGAFRPEEKTYTFTGDTPCIPNAEAAAAAFPGDEKPAIEVPNQAFGASEPMTAKKLFEVVREHMPYLPGSELTELAEQVVYFSKEILSSRVSQSGEKWKNDENARAEFSNRLKGAFDLK